MLDSQSFSEPVAQVSRHDNSTVVRVFHLKEKDQTWPASFDEMHDQLKNELLYKTSDTEKEMYIKALKKRLSKSFLMENVILHRFLKKRGKLAIYRGLDLGIYDVKGSTQYGNNREPTVQTAN